MKMIEISELRYKQLCRAEAHLNQLEILGVDNWGGYVGEMFYCNSCHEENEWYEVEDDKCPSCGEEKNYW